MGLTKPFQAERFWILASIWTQMPSRWASNPNGFDRPFPKERFWILASVWTQMPSRWTSNPNGFDHPFPKKGSGYDQKPQKLFGFSNYSVKSLTFGQHMDLQMPYWSTSNPNVFDQTFPSRKVLDFAQRMDSNAIKMDFKSQWIWPNLSKQKGSGFFSGFDQKPQQVFWFCISARWKPWQLMQMIPPTLSREGNLH